MRMILSTTRYHLLKIRSPAIDTFSAFGLNFLRISDGHNILSPDQFALIPNFSILAFSKILYE